MAVTLTVKDTGTHSGGLIALTWTAGYVPTAGTVILFLITSRNGGDGSAPGWTKVASSIGGGGFTDSIVAFAKVSVGGETSWTPDDAFGNDGDWLVAEVTGVDLSTVVGDGGSGTGTTLTAPTITPSGAGDALIIGAWAQTQDNAKTFGAGAGWTSFWDEGGSTHPCDFAVYRIAPAGVSYTPAATSNRTNGWWSISIAFGGLAEPGMWVDWDKDGFGTSLASGSSDYPLARMLPEIGATSGTLDNITADVVGGTVRINRPSGKPGTMTFQVKNANGKYNPDNTASVLYGKLKPDLPVWFGVNADGTLSGAGQTVYGRFGGYIREIVPIPEGGSSGFADIICDDALGRYQKHKPRVTFSTSRTIGSYRTAILDAIGESRTTLCTEADALAFSGTVGIRGRSVVVIGDTGSITTIGDIGQLISRNRDTPPDALALLEELNDLAGTRHYINPGASKEAWYSYTTIPRTHKLADTADASLNADNIQSTSGYRVTKDNIINLQEVEVQSTTVSGTPVTVWTHGDVPFSMTASTAVQIVANFGDYVFDAAHSIASSGAAVSSSFVSYGDGGVVTLTAAGAATVTAVTVTGRRVNRASALTVEERSPSSITEYGESPGQRISSELMQSVGLAKGIAAYHVWRHAAPLKTGKVQIANLLSTTLPREMHDVVTMTFDKLHMTARRFEIMSMEEAWHVAASASVVHADFTFELEETPNQTALQFFRVGVSLLGGTDGLAP